MNLQQQPEQKEFDFFKTSKEMEEKNELLDLLFYSSLTLFTLSIILHTFYFLLPLKLVALLLEPLVNTSTSGLLIWLNIKALLFVKQTIKQN